MAEAVKSCACCAEEPTEEELLARLDEVLAQYKSTKAGRPDPGSAPGAGDLRLPAWRSSIISRELRKLYRGRRRGELLLVLPHGPAWRARRPRLPGHGLLRARRQGRLEAKKSWASRWASTTGRPLLPRVGRCFGACGLAPVIMIDEEVHHRVKPSGSIQMLPVRREPAADKEGVNMDDK